ncbi:MAG: ptpA 7 [Chthonomonadaceae bacterium]|nr:ptpA 7 [Chthonomonadaceae bacterium]
MRYHRIKHTLGLAAALLALFHSGAQAQDRLRTMPVYSQFQQASQQLNAAMGSFYNSGVTGIVWAADGKAMGYAKGGKNYRCDLSTHQTTEVATPVKGSAQPAVARRRGGGGGLERGRQYASALSPDGKRKAFYKDDNLWLSGGDDSNPVQITTDGSKAARIKYGTASWVYGEELEQHTAMWWSPDSRRVAFYRFDESKVPDYYLAMNALKVQDTLDVEAYPKAGAPNPIADIVIYDTQTKQNLTIDARDGQPFADATVGHYLYGVEWTQDSSELLLHRTNRKQDIMEYVACNPVTGKCRVVVRETWPATWTENLPTMQFLADGKRFLWISERTGYRNLYLYDLSGKLLATLTKHPFEVTAIARVDDATNTVFYTARDGDSPYKFQLHRVSLEGTGEKRLTDPAFSHQVQIAPDGKYFVDVAQAHDVAPITRLVDGEGKVLQTLGQADMTAMKAKGFQPGETFTYKSADGKFNCYGVLYKPSTFDPTKKYPMLVSVYAGPGVGVAPRESFAMPNALTELGFLVAEFDGRGQEGQGKAFKDALYRHHGLPEIDDQAEGVKFLRQRPYVDGANVGIFGTSYGGYASAMALLRYPDVFRAASASSAVTDWRNYDSVYTERFMGMPDDNKTGYDFGSAMTHVDSMKGHLLLYYGTADNNVHPTNTYQLIQALSRAGKAYDLQIGPDQGHTGVNFSRMMEFFLDHLVLNPATPTNK